MVVGILAALTTMLLPSYFQVRRLGARTVCRGNLRRAALAVRAYLETSNDVMPVAAQMPSLDLNDDPPIAEVLRPYLGSPETLLCPADPGQLYFRREGSSYEYHSMLGGRTVEETFLTRRFGAERTPVMNDYEPFHGRAGTPGAMNYLFADTHVGDME